MAKKRCLVLLVSILLLLLFGTGVALVQGAPANKEAQVTMKGKIGYMERSGGYYVMGENPPSEVFIVNQNKKVLEKLKLSGETVTIEGRFTIGADHLKIEKINGKKY